MFDPKVIPCDFCRTPLPADMPGKLVLGEFIGHACDACAEGERGRLRVRLLARAGVPAHFLAKLETLQKRPLPDEPWILIQGAVGTGKTHLAVEHVLSFDDPKRVRFVDWPDFVETRRQSIGDDKVRDPMPLVRPFGGLLVLDDLGAEAPTPYAAESANLVLGYRYNENLRTIITTNLDGAALERVYGARLTSRISGAARLVSPRSKRDRRSRAA